MSAASRNRRRDWKPAFLAALEETGMVASACESAGIGRRTAYDHRQKDEEFAVAWADVEERTTERMEREAYRRGVEGVVTRIVTNKDGEVIGEERNYSDTLLIFMLKARRPETYRDNVKVEHSGKIKHEAPVIPDDQERRRQVAQLLNDAGALGDGSDG